MLDVRALTFGYPEGPRFCFDLAVEKGEILVLQGPSGIGKSTLLHLVAGLLPAESGAVCWQGKDITSLAADRRPLSILFQDHNLFDHLDNRTNIALGLDPKLNLSAEDQQRITDAMQRLGIASLGHRRPDEISGGQKQRVALARALVRSQVQGRSLLLLDEPFSALDPEIRQESSDLVRMLVREHGLTAVVVSHDEKDAETLATRVFTLSPSSAPLE